jgi:hypothetical protein
MGSLGPIGGGRSEAKAEEGESRSHSMRGNKNASGHRLSFKARCRLAKQMRARWKERNQLVRRFPERFRPRRDKFALPPFL